MPRLIYKRACFGAQVLQSIFFNSVDISYVFFSFFPTHMSRTQIEHFRQFFLNVISVLSDKDNQRQSVYREECS